MAKFAVIMTGGKQYLVKENDEIVVEHIASKENDSVELPTLAVFDDTEAVEVGAPYLKTSVKGQVLAHVKGEKIRVAKFKSKVRYRRVTGFRPSLSKVKIVSI